MFTRLRDASIAGVGDEARVMVRVTRGGVAVMGGEADLTSVAYNYWQNSS